MKVMEDTMDTFTKITATVKTIVRHDEKGNCSWACKHLQIDPEYCNIFCVRLLTHDVLGCPVQCAQCLEVVND